MEGVKRLRLCPSYLKQFDFKKGKIEGISKLEEIRTPENLKDLISSIRKKSNIKAFDIIANINDKEVRITKEELYQSALNSSKTNKLDIFIFKRNQHPTSSKSPSKKRKTEEAPSHPYFLYLCKPISIRQVKFINVLSHEEKVLKSDLFSKTARYLSSGDKVFITGGRKVPTQVLIVDVKSWEISVGPSLNIGRYWHSATLIDNKIAVIGGTTGEKEQKASLKSVEVFDNNQWTLHSDMNSERSSTSCCYHGKYTFVFYGDYYLNCKMLTRSNYERWNGTAWEQLHLSFKCSYSAAMYALSDQRVLILGGYTDDNKRKTSVLCYDITKNSLSKHDDLHAPMSFTYNQVVSVSDKLYLFGSDSRLVEYDIDSL